jgi:hypothetical protein
VIGWPLPLDLISQVVITMVDNQVVIYAAFKALLMLLLTGFYVRFGVI